MADNEQLLPPGRRLDTPYHLVLVTSVAPLLLLLGLLCLPASASAASPTRFSWSSTSSTTFLEPLSPLTPVPVEARTEPDTSTQPPVQLYPVEQGVLALSTIPKLPWHPPILSPDVFRIAMIDPRLLHCRVSTSEPTPHVFPLQPQEPASYGEVHHDYPAADIAAPLGTKFVAVTDGVIDELRRDDLYLLDPSDGGKLGGRYVSIIGVDGVRYYGSHLHEVVPGLEAGDCVGAGQLLGYVGTSGNAAGTPPHLHFGISYPTHPGDWIVRRGVVCPQPYLDAWKAGIDMTPIVSDPERLDRDCVFLR